MKKRPREIGKLKVDLSNVSSVSGNHGRQLSPEQAEKELYRMARMYGTWPRGYTSQEGYEEEMQRWIMGENN